LTILALLATGSVLLAGVYVFSQPGGRKPSPHELDVKLRPQQKMCWCWAASAEMIMTYYGQRHSQEEQAKAEFNGQPTDDPAWPKFDRYGFRCTTKDKEHLSWDDIKGEIDARRPFCFAKRWIGGGGHMLVVYGYAEKPDGSQWLLILDPAPTNVGDTLQMSFTDYCDGRNTAPPFEHWRDFYGISPSSN
jgi:hypothetical protein